jgi:glycosyltransferase involved in cell wall biosynthesis
MPTPTVSVVMPCLNEERTLANCIRAARQGIADAGIEGEIVVADNGSTDRSIEIAESLGARVVRVAARGYGNALRAGFAAARGEWILMGDADESYDFTQLPRFGEKIREGNDLVMGSRMTGRIEKDAMPWLHRYIGNPALSGILRVLFNVKEVLTARAGRESAIFLGISAHPADRPKWPGMQSRSESGPRVVLTETGRSVCPF